MIPFNRPFLPPQELYAQMLDGIWERDILTNNGPLVKELEQSLQSFLQADHLLFTSNGTIALQLAIKALELKGEIITTPFSFVATTSSIVWENCKPVFADIHPDTLNIEPNTIEPLISSNTSAILATHVYGNPCDILAIEKIAQQHELKVIYDAAHCFGTTYQSKSVYRYGDISIASFHATKPFHTIEGGAVFTSSPALNNKVYFLRNFGHNGPEQFASIGINGKNSEFHAAMGIVNLQFADEILGARKQNWYQYADQLNNSGLQLLNLTEPDGYNHAYFPVIFESETQLLNIKEELERHGIGSRRYFYPLLSSMPFIQEKQTATPVADSIVGRVLCLPLYYGLTAEQIDYVCSVIHRTLSGKFIKHANAFFQ